MNARIDVKICSKNASCAQVYIPLLSTNVESMDTVKEKDNDMFTFWLDASIVKVIVKAILLDIF